MTSSLVLCQFPTIFNSRDFLRLRWWLLPSYSLLPPNVSLPPSSCPEQRSRLQTNASISGLRPQGQSTDTGKNYCCEKQQAETGLIVFLICHLGTKVKSFKWPEQTLVSRLQNSTCVYKSSTCTPRDTVSIPL